MDINYLAVLLAALSAFFLGFLWYSVLFVNPWKKEIGMDEATEEDQAPGLAKFLIISLLIEIVIAVTLAIFIGSDADWQSGLSTGLTAGIGLAATALALHYMYEGRSLKLWGINAGYIAVTFGVMGMIIGAM